MAEAALIAVGKFVLGKAFSALYDKLKELIDKNKSDASIMEKAKSRLDSLKPLIDKLMEDDSEQDLKVQPGLLKVIDEGKALIGGYVVRGKDPKRKNAKEFDEWDAKFKAQLDLLTLELGIESRAYARTAADNTEKMLPAVQDTNTAARTAADNTEQMIEMVNGISETLSETLTKQNQCEEDEAYSAVPELQGLKVGLDGPLNELKRMMFAKGKSMIVVNAIGGSGKTTLATKFCRDSEIQEKFKNNIFFVTVTEKFNLELIVQHLHKRKGLPEPPSFTNEDDAVTSLQRFLKKEEHNPFLLVLDDVWPESEYRVNKFRLEEMKDNKIIVTSRSQLPKFISKDSQYKLEALNDQDAMELFNHPVKSSPYPEFAKTIVDSSYGSPILLKFRGALLNDQPMEIWTELIESLKHHLAIAPGDEVSYSLQRSLDILKDEDMKKRFLDLGAFPDHRRISVGALVDMWEKLDDPSPDRDKLINEGEDVLCYAKLIKLKSRNLVDNFVDTRKDKIDEDRYRKGNYVILHDLMKQVAEQNLAIVAAEERERLIAHIRGNKIPKWWKKLKKDEEMQARLLSVSTGDKFSKKLPNIKLPKAKVLLLNFQTEKYALPEFVENMPKLRILLVKYDVPSYHSCAKFENFKQLDSLPNLKRIRLEKLSMHSITSYPFTMKSLLKMSLILCDLSGASSNGCVKISAAFPSLQELIIDHCYNCMEFLGECCDLVHLTKLSIINCHGLQLLLKRIGNLTNLEFLRIRSCKELLEVPVSVAMLRKLTFLDISECINISDWSRKGEPSSLVKLDLRHCRDTDMMRDAVLNLKQLKEVICTSDDSTEKLWEAVEPNAGRICILKKDIVEIDTEARSGRLSSYSGLESANFVLTSDPVHQAWNAIQAQKKFNPNAEPCLFNEIQPENPTIIAFGTPPSSLCGKEGLVSSSSLKEDYFTPFEFLCDKSSPNFSLNEAAVELFKSNYDELLHLKEKLVKKSNSESPTLVIITGHSLGGSVATLFTLWLLQDFNKLRVKCLLCVTFGSPLIGDENLRQRVYKHLAWKSCFLNVVSDQDPTPGQFFLLHPDKYKPFGIFLLCSSSGCACFEEPVIILKQLVETNSANSECHYGQILAHLKCKALSKVSESAVSDMHQLDASLITQLQSIGVPCQETMSLIHHMKMCEKKLLIQKKKYSDSDSDKKLNEMKVHMAFLEWYKKASRQSKRGYYDNYVIFKISLDLLNVYEFKKKLMNYWEDCVTEVEVKPQRAGAHFRPRWLWEGTSYRRMVEPLHIGDYYRGGGQNYKTHGKRPKHFILLEEWLNNEDKPQEPPSKSRRESARTRMNEDSCFWAEVEDARISCRLVKNGSVEEKEQALQELKKFEAYVYASLKNYALDTDIFLEKSSFMQWLQEYKEVVDSSYSSLLLDFMNERNHEAYKAGTFIFP